MEPVRKAAESAVARPARRRRSVLVGLTADKAPAGPTPRRGAPAGRVRPAAPRRADAEGRRRAGRQARSSPSPRGKGGVGKSTTAANLALGARRRTGLQGRPARRRHLRPVHAEAVRHLTASRGCVDGRMLEPMEAYGLKVMSIGFLVDEETPMIWRGPMVMSAHHPDAARGRLGRARRAGRRHAAGHRRRPAHHGAADAARRRRHRLDAAGSRADRCAARRRHVPARSRCRSSASSRT